VSQCSTVLRIFCLGYKAVTLNGHMPIKFTTGYSGRFKKSC